MTRLLALLLCFSFAASNEPHTPWDKGDSSQYPPQSLKLPPVLVDSPDTREGFSKYLAEVTYFDSQVGWLATAAQNFNLHPVRTLWVQW
jgi:uncharacterized sulfatase